MSTDGHGLGRRVAIDDRDRAYPMRMLLPARERVVSRRYYRAGPTLDQGAYPHCVGFAWRQFLSSALLMTKDGPNARDIYFAAQRVDEWPGENYDGTSVRAGVKVLQSLGHIASYLWAWDAATVRDWLLAGTGTVVLGTYWRDGMMEPDKKTGIIRADGAALGGHAYLCIGFSRPRHAFRILNSWGKQWGQKGRAWLPFDDLDRLLADQGEACAAVEQKATV